MPEIVLVNNDWPFMSITEIMEMEKNKHRTKTKKLAPSISSEFEILLSQLYYSLILAEKKI